MLTLRWAILLLALTTAGIPAQRPDRDKSPVRNFIPPRLVHAEPAVYPAGVPPSNIERGCILSAVIGPDGAPASIQVLRSIGPDFDAAAMDAVRQSQFNPGEVDGKPARATMDLWVVFKRDKGPAIPQLLPSSGVQRPTLINNVPAHYSDKAREAKYQGIVLLRLIVDEEGLPIAVEVLRPLGMGLDEEAVKAVNQYRFKPAVKDGQPVPARISVEVSFRLH
jgi:TonB family protein